MYRTGKGVLKGHATSNYKERYNSTISSLDVWYMRMREKKHVKQCMLPAQL